MAPSVRPRHRLPTLFPPPEFLRGGGEKKDIKPVRLVRTETSHHTRNGSRPDRHGPGGTRGPELIRSELSSESRVSCPEEARPRYREVQQEGTAEAAGRGEVDRRESGPALLGSGGSDGALTPLNTQHW